MFAAYSVERVLLDSTMNVNDLAGFFEIRPLAGRLEDLETPVPVIDLDVVDRNLRAWQSRCDALGLGNRPHIKTHKLTGLARCQMALGAIGITVQKLGEAEIMADAGISAMLLTFNIVGRTKLARLAALARRTAISVVADHADLLPGLGEAGRSAGRDLAVLVECDTGAARNGVQTPEAAAELARAIAATPGLSYGGLMTYPRPGGRLDTEAFLAAARELIAASGLATSIISTGGTPDMWQDDGLAIATEYRPGTYVYNDRSLVERGVCRFEDCALTVLTTVVSVPTASRAVIDAGSKALTSDLLGLESFGVVHALGGAAVYALSEEHGLLDIRRLTTKPRVGDLVRVTPNHVCPVSNLFDSVVLVRGAQILGAVRVDARGAVH